MTAHPASRPLARPFVATTLLVVLAAAGCGQAPDGRAPASAPLTAASAATSSPSVAGDHTEADVMFSLMMVPHHLQAIEMADLVPSRSRNPEVLALAKRISAEQGPEVQQMTTWLGAWRADPEMGQDELADHWGHPGSDGMMSPDDLRELGRLDGAAFDRRWLAMMIQHHQGAVDMAQEVVRTGRHTPTRELARRIVAGQQAEIAQMRAMLAR